MAILTKPLNGRAPCHYCGPCERGCVSRSYFNAAFTTVADALKTGQVVEMVQTIDRLPGDVMGALQAALQQRWTEYQNFITNTNPWNRYGSTWDGTTQRLYVNGTQVASAPLSGTAPWLSLSTKRANSACIMFIVMRCRRGGSRFIHFDLASRSFKHAAEGSQIRCRTLASTGDRDPRGRLAEAAHP